jgi:uncharacterized protein
MPRRPMSQADSRNWAMGAHLSAILGAMVGGIASFVGPLIVWLLRREDDPYSAAHALEALNFNLTALLIFVAGGIAALLTFGLALIPLIVFGVLWLVWSIQAAMAASRGEPYRYPMSIRFIS